MRVCGFVLALVMQVKSRKPSRHSTNSMAERQSVLFATCAIMVKSKSLFEHATAALGGVDILVNNAGIGIFAPVEEMAPEDFRAILETNLFGVFYCCHEAIPLMKGARRRVHHQHFFARRRQPARANGRI